MDRPAPGPADPFHGANVICCVRNRAWGPDSLESLAQRDPYELSGIFGFTPAMTVHARVEGLARPNGLMGFAFNALRGAVYGPHPERLMLLRCESFVNDPPGALAAIHDFIGEPMGGRGPMNIAPCYDMLEFDRRPGAPGLHDVGRRVHPLARRPCCRPTCSAATPNTPSGSSPNICSRARASSDPPLQPGSCSLRSIRIDGRPARLPPIRVGLVTTEKPCR